MDIYHDANVEIQYHVFASNLSRFEEIYQHDLAGPTAAGLDWKPGGIQVYCCKRRISRAGEFYTTDYPTSYAMKIFKSDQWPIVVISYMKRLVLMIWRGIMLLIS